MDPSARITLSFDLLRYSYGAVLLLAGLDKILATNLITDWARYISPFALSLLPISVPIFLIAMGVIEVAVAAMLFAKLTRAGGYLSIAWLLLISINLVLGGYIDVAVRDVLLAVGAAVLVVLTPAAKAASSAHA